MAAVILTMPGPPGAPYPNGGDEAYWMGQVRGALASRLAHNGIALLFGFPEEPSPGDFHLALCSQQAPPGEEGARKGPRLLCGPGTARAGGGRGSWPAAWGRPTPSRSWSR